MIDIRFVRENPDVVRESQRRRGNDESTVDALLAADDSRRAALQAFEAKRAEQKDMSRSVGKASPEERPAILAKAKELSEQVKELEWRLSVLEIKFNPYAYSGLDMGNVYIIDDLGDFPPEAPIGAIGFDPDSGKIWRNT